jgi:integrase
MPRAAERLTARTAQAAKKPGLYADGRGLCLRVGPSGSKAWVFRYMLHGKAHNMGLGPYPDISLAEARERARECRRQRLDGIDPIEARKATRMAGIIKTAKAMTFQQCAEAFIAAHQAGWRNAKHRQQWSNTLAAYAFPILGGLPVAAIDVGLVMKVTEPIWQAKPETASRVRGRVESVLDWAMARGYRTGENPARWKGHLDKLLPARAKVQRVAHHPALPYPEIAEFMAKLREREGIAARALEFAILTAARTGEVIGARWSEFDLEAKMWLVPAERMKAGREHRVALSDAAIAILSAMGRKGDRVFPISDMAMLMLLRRIGRTDLTVHGFRSTFADWVSEQTGFPSEVREMALAHQVGDKVEAAYRRGDLFVKRRQLAEAWARFCLGGEPEVIALWAAS